MRASVPTRPEVLEVTLRDGAYLVDFQFTAQDTALVVSALEAAGIRWIEVGHGLGLNAATGAGTAGATDEEYLHAAASAARQAHWGAFFIPGIGRAEDLRRAADHGMHFVRVGTHVSEVERAAPFLQLARELGLFVSYNGMKSYAVPPEEFGRCAARAQAWGAQVVCLVDSAGGMGPEDVRDYLRAARSASDVALGFHGHDNLTLAMANTLQALDEGAVLVDSSLQGVGRSAGNTVTEALVVLLKRRGLLPEVDLNLVLDLGQNLLEPALRRRGLDPLAVTAGAARFHSSFTPKVRAYATRYGIDIRDLITRLCQEDQNDAPDELLDALAKDLAERRRPRGCTIRAFGVERPRPCDSAEALRSLLAQLRQLGMKSGKFTALNVVQEEGLREVRVSGNVHAATGHIIGSAALGTEEQLRLVLGMADGQVDVVLLDADRKPGGPRAADKVGRELLRRSLLLSYSDSQVWLAAVEEQVTRLLDEVVGGRVLLLAGGHPLLPALASSLARRGAEVWLEGQRGPAPEAFDLAAAWAGRGGPWEGQDWLGRLPAGAYVLDAGVGSVSQAALASARERGLLPVRINIWPALTGALVAAHESARVRREAMGWATLDGAPVVAGGALGREGDVIVDSVRDPRRVIGVADGRGGVVFDYPPGAVARVEEHIRRRVLASSG